MKDFRFQIQKHVIVITRYNNGAISIVGQDPEGKRVGMALEDPGDGSHKAQIKSQMDSYISNITGSEKDLAKQWVDDPESVNA